ncbi:conserved hypothetical protein [Hymenobacter roseosalivarius DSM 11622]|uniref:DUF4394 domain-containing protein n=1 Tax=Hymenobacter roseosalivarius DSM 11622 TaxID=645990 RepID=A0A1W1W3X1_9BACT|nr:DUF4394 domain-containing protein [Hymenobacter roseosalivarius]SMC00203.1 conserved hypothetical protein [Hymenobacter roseosalivarius DSM 11622]
MLKSFSLAKWGVAVLLLSSLSSCEDIMEQYFPKPNPTTPTFPSLGLDIPFYALSGGTKLDAYSTKDAAKRLSSVALTGLQSGETLLAIDFRPATGQLYGVSSASRLYVINQNTGAARAIGASAFTPALGGNLVGFDFNPTVDRIRLVTSTGQNLRLNPETGTVAATDGVLNGATGATITGAAYTNNTAGASTTALYTINTQNQQLYLVNPPNNGTLVPVGSLNLNISGDGGFDIDAKTGTALGLYTVKGKPTLFTVDLSTGATRPLAEYGANLGYSGIAIPTQPVAYVVDSNNTFSVFNLTTPSNLISKPITGLLGDEVVIGLDFRPANGQLYAISRNRLANGGQLYTINAATGAATLVGRLSPRVTFSFGTGFDFDPVADRIINTADESFLMINPLDASVTGEGSVSGGTGNARLDNKFITAVAYDNNYAGATSTTLYGINARRSEVVRFRFSPDPTSRFIQANYEIVGIIEGGVREGSNELNGFDIGGMSNTAYGVFTNFYGEGPNPNKGVLYAIDLQNATQKIVGVFPQPVTGFTVGLGF